ncbi:MAG: type II toxin-antitoxin system VapC family toxin [Planctomycetota bacterium]|nr:type II toxin-antitoxin system VapC family toxin [Planctomycetota bacterium]
MKTNKARYLLDTSFVIDYLHGVSFANAFANEAGIRGGKSHISVISKIEVLSFNKYSKEERFGVRLFLDRFPCVPLNEAVEELTIDIRSAFRLKLPDAIVAASAVHMNAILVTSDKRLAATSFPGLCTVNPQSR